MRSNCRTLNHLALSFRRCWIEKIREPWALFFDLTSHLMLLSILVILFYSSTVSTFPSRSYSSVNLNIPPLFISDPQSSNIQKFNELITTLSGPLPILSLDQYISLCHFLRENFYAEVKMLTKTPFRTSALTILNAQVLYFAPRSSDVLSLIQFMNQSYPHFRSLEVRIRSSEHAVLDEIRRSPKVMPLGFIQLQRSSPFSFETVIRQSRDPYFSTNQFLSNIWTGFDISYVNYWMGGFYSLARAVEAWRCHETSGCELSQFAVTAITPYPTGEYKVFSFFSSVQSMVGIFFCSAFLFPVARHAQYIVNDKEMYVRDSLVAMGFDPYAYALGMFVFHFAMYVWIAVSAALFLALTIFSHTQFSLLLVTFLLFSLCLQQVVGTISNVVHRAKLAAAFAALFVFMSGLPRYFVISSTEEQLILVKYILCVFFPSSALIFAIEFMSSAELVGKGAEMSSFNRSQFNLTSSLLCLVCSLVLYFSLSQGVLFAVGRNHRSDAQHNRSDPWVSNEIEPLAFASNISKTFDDGFTALQPSSLSLFENEIVSLLGSNGAGKSTLVSIICGTLTPTSGYIRWKRGSRSDIVGICNQRDVLIPRLTVEEHLLIVLGIRGFSWDSPLAAMEVLSLLKALHLFEHRHVHAHFLSGGMKRKLCLALALAGNPPLVILDEPTSGVDVLSRRAIWNLLRRRKGGKSILLTTHFMDEAESLSDKVYTIANGKSMGHGSVENFKGSMDLPGYFLSFTRSDSFDEEYFGDVLQREIQMIDTTIHSSKDSTPEEVVFHIPLVDKRTLMTLFRRLKTIRHCFDTVNLHTATLEDAFLKMKGWNSFQPVISPMMMSSGEETPMIPTMTRSPARFRMAGHESGATTVTVFSLLIRKKLLISYRDLQGTCAILVLPGIAMLITIMILMIELSPPYQPLELRSQTFQKRAGVHPRVLVNFQRPSHLLVQNASVGYVSAMNSSAMNNILKENPLDVKGSTAALVLRDAIPVHVVVNDQWMRDHRLQSAKIEEYLQTIGVELHQFQKVANQSTNTTQPTSTPEQYSHFFTTWHNYLTLFHRSPYIHEAAIFNSEVARHSLQSKISFTYHPLPEKESVETISQIQLSIVMVILLLIPIASVPASLIASIVREKSNKCKLIQHLNGVSKVVYWTANWCIDLGMILIPVVLFMIGLVSLRSVSQTVFTASWEAFAALSVLFLSYAFAILPFCYVLTAAYSSELSPTSVVVAILLVNVVSGFGFTIAYFLLLSSLQRATVALGILRFGFSVFPSFNLGYGMVCICTAYYQHALRRQTTQYFSWGVCLSPILILLAEGVIFLVMLLVIDEPRDVTAISRASLRINSPQHRKISFFQDDDVLAEEAAVLNVLHSTVQHQGNHVSELDMESHSHAISREFPLVMHQICKSWSHRMSCLPGPRRARTEDSTVLRGVSLACREGEVLGLLGANGAGKTTLMRVLTRDTQLSSGTVLINGKPLSNRSTSLLIGYCPQVDPVIESMTSHEMLWFYGRLRGIPSSTLRPRIESLVTSCGLVPHLNRPARYLSGGNKRKLSLAIALIGDPKVLLLDEPTTGMDPETRRQIWRVIKQASSDRVIVLVSHFMDEIEALCTRVAVLVAGQIRCLGPIPHLKAKFKTGYKISFQCNPQRVDDCIQRCSQFLVPQDVADEEEIKVEEDFVKIQEVSPSGQVVLTVGRNVDLINAFTGFDGITDEFDIDELNIVLDSLDVVFQKSMEGGV